MPTTATLVAFAAATMAILVVPGPSVLYLIGRSIGQGRSAGMVSMLGIETGALLHAVGAAAGLAALLASSPGALAAIRYAGAAYLAHLGIKQLRASRAHAEGAEILAAVSRRRAYVDGILVDLLNPKTALFFIAFLPMFVDPAQGPVAAQLLVLGLSFVALAVVVDSSYALAASTLAQRIRTSGPARRHLGRASGCIYLGLAGLAGLA